MFSKIRYNIDCLCVDIDECSASINVCDALNTICVNTIGSFSCICTNGYTQAGDGKICVLLREYISQLILALGCYSLS